MTHHDTKRLYLAYRAKARELYEDVGLVESAHVHVSDHANVQMTEDGAFVEVTVWVPKEKL